MQQDHQNKYIRKRFHFDQHLQSNNINQTQQLKHNSVKLYIGNLNTNVTEEDINELLGLKPTVHLRQNCSAEMADKNTAKSKVFSFLKILRMYLLN